MTQDPSNEILFPRNTLIVLCGPAACGKSTWATRHFRPTQIVSSDQCRAMVSDDPADQSVSGYAFDLMHFIIEKRLKLGRLTVADATNLEREHRSTLNRIARKYQFNLAAVVFDVALETCLARNASRQRNVPEEALRQQFILLQKTLRTIETEGFSYVYRLDERTQSNVTVRIARYINRQAR